jgi:glycosyltransferase involved in cell wall biosynthesis
MTNITIVVNHLIDGGAARVVAHLSQAWAEMGRRVTILTMDDGKRPAIYALHPDVAHIPLDLQETSGNPLTAILRNLHRLIRLRQAIRATRADLLVSFLDSGNIKCLLATRTMPRLPIIISERTDPHGRSIGAVWEGLRRLTYPWADCLVTQTRHAMDFFPARVRAKGRVIPNPVILPSVGDLAPQARDRRRILTLGRLQKVKGHDQLIEAFAMVAAQFPDWDLHIHGDGPERTELEARVRNRDLERRVFIGRTSPEVGNLLREADLFVLPSRVEGFPNALAEAMASGLAVISFDCASGPAELIRQDLDGLLVPPGDVPALAKAMARLMADPVDRARLAARAPEVLARYSQVKVLELWESTIQSVRKNPLQPPPPRKDADHA